MLREREKVAGPGIAKDPQVKVRALSAFFVAGREYAPGDELHMQKSDALFNVNCIVPPRVELL